MEAPIPCRCFFLIALKSQQNQLELEFSPPIEKAWCFKFRSSNLCSYGMNRLWRKFVVYFRNLFLTFHKILLINTKTTKKKSTASPSQDIWDRRVQNRQRRLAGCHRLLSKLLVSPLITPIVVPYVIPYIIPFKEVTDSAPLTRFQGSWRQVRGVRRRAAWLPSTGLLLRNLNEVTIMGIYIW